MRSEVNFYRSKRNPNKYLEVRRYRNGSIYVRQFMWWKETGIKSFSGDERLHRWRILDLMDLLSDYVFIGKEEVQL